MTVHTTGEITPVVVVTDNGPAYRSQPSPATSARVASSPSAHPSPVTGPPGTNGVLERFYKALKYEHLYRVEIPDGDALAREVDAYLDVYNTVRPHEALDFDTPMSRYLPAGR